MINIAQNYVIVDTGFVVALCHDKDEHHKKSLQVLEQLEGSSQPQFVSTIFVVHEICWLLRSRCGSEQVVDFLRMMQDNSIFSVKDLPKDWMTNAANILDKYSDKEFDLTDVSLVVLAESLDTGDILSVDVKDFSILRWGYKKPFNNLFK